MRKIPGHCGWCHPWVTVLGSMRKQIEQATWAKPVSSTISWPLLQLLLQNPVRVPVLTSFDGEQQLCRSVSQMNLFLPNLLFFFLFVMVFPHSNRSSKTVRKSTMANGKSSCPRGERVEGHAWSQSLPGKAKVLHRGKNATSGSERGGSSWPIDFPYNLGRVT